MPLFYMVCLSRRGSQANCAVNASPCAFYALVMTSRRFLQCALRHAAYQRLLVSGVTQLHKIPRIAPLSVSKLWPMIRQSFIATVGSHPTSSPSGSLNPCADVKHCAPSSVSPDVVFPLVDLFSCNQLSCTVPSLNEGVPQIVPIPCPKFCPTRRCLPPGRLVFVWPT